MEGANSSRKEDARDSNFLPAGATPTPSIYGKFGFVGSNPTLSTNGGLRKWGGEGDQVQTFGRVSLSNNKKPRSEGESRKDRKQRKRT